MSYTNITPQQLRARLLERKELALVDVRETGTYSKSHLLWAATIPLSRLEVMFPALVPRSTVPVVLCDAGEGLAQTAATRLVGFGYTDVAVLEGDTHGWEAAGFELFSGVNVPSKAFGEYVEHRYDTPNITAEELKARQDAGENLVVLDSRPMPEFYTMSIPGGRCVPGAELAYRVHDMVTDADTTVVVNCAGRTRSIIGAQSLINAGIPNPVMALRNGTMAWHLAGYDLARGATDRPTDISESAINEAKVCASGVAERFEVQFINTDELARFQTESASKTLYLLDVRSPEEYAEGHLPGSVNAPGGQLVQATDEYAAVLGARLVLIDDTSVRATMTASWLNQLGWQHVFVLRDGLTSATLETGVATSTILGNLHEQADIIDSSALSAGLKAGDMTLIDVGSSRQFKRGHIAGAQHMTRVRLEASMESMPKAAHLVVTSEDGLLARIAAADIAQRSGRSVQALASGNQGWLDAGYSLTAGTDGLDPDAQDVWVSPYDNAATLEQSMQAYLDWEIALVEQLKRDGTTAFR